ncbi:DUF748 domain-containing protein [Saccharicrinis fermentans]|uniref:DUF748 domain-containing protein n=1 Tax=Saccharicrinis fermentans DSM 9555 = JCM 21142 TaxID=869213 RepID=W7Y5U3_9BACT|nr:DUF748 domain-containing protein [Saccharicrinis fermentans]GAF03517.1 hypothetical protein JCM21142_52194 [Saccharicrinis fermentans DSM 9555 = JCM 21142]
MANVKKRYLIPGIITLLLFIILFFLSTVIKNYLVNNSQQLIGRKLTLEELHINYFKVQLNAHNFTLFEENKKDTFVYFKELLINYDPWKMLSSEYAVAQIRLIEPYIYIENQGKAFNFDSLIPSSDSLATTKDELPDGNDSVKFSIHNIELVKGKFLYHDRAVNNLLEFDKLNLKLPLIAWDSRSSEMGVEFSIGERGIVKIEAEIDQQLAAYNIHFGTENIQLNSFTNYLKDYLYISTLNGLLQSDIHVKGSIESLDNIVINGVARIDSLQIRDNKGSILASARTAQAKMDTLDLGNMRYTINKIYINQPYISAVLEKDMSNWEYFLTPYFANSVQATKQDSLINSKGKENLYYRIDTLVVNNGQVQFADHTLNRPFSYKISDINMEMNTLTELNDAIPLKWAMRFNNNGTYKGETHFSLRTPLNLFYQAQINNLDMHSFSPYTEYYLGYPIISGLFNYECSLEMTPRHLKNDNHLLVKEPEFGRKTNDSTAHKLPLKLALYLIKDAKDNVDFDLPVTGNPSEPGFKLGPLIWKTFGKFIAKTATQPFSSLGKLVGTNPEQLKHIPFEYTQDSLRDEQINTLDKIAEILSKKKDLIFTFRQELAVDEEMSILASKTIKNKYIQDTKPQKIEHWKQIKDQDPLFLAYLNQLSPETTAQTIPQRCLKLVSKTDLAVTFKALYKKRNQLLRDYLLTQKSCDATSIILQNVDFNNMPQDLKKPGYRVVVSIK